MADSRSSPGLRAPFRMSESTMNSLRSAAGPRWCATGPGARRRRRAIDHVWAVSFIVAGGDVGLRRPGSVVAVTGCAWVRCPAGQRRRTRSNWDVPHLHRGEPLIGCGLVQRLPARRALRRFDPFDLVDVGGLQPRALAPGLAAGFASLGPFPLRHRLSPLGLGRGRIRARRQEEFELSIDSRRRNSAFSAVSRSISSPCESTSWSWTCARSACSRTVSA
jgi:hypothetical protein